MARPREPASMRRPSMNDSRMPIPTPMAVRLLVWPHREPQDVAARGAERHADADLVRALRDHVRHHAVDTDHREQQRQPAEDEHDGAEVLQADRPLVQRAPHRLEVEDRLRRIDGSYGSPRVSAASVPDRGMFGRRAPWSASGPGGTAGRASGSCGG